MTTRFLSFPDVERFNSLISFGPSSVTPSGDFVDSRRRFAPSDGDVAHRGRARDETFPARLLPDDFRDEELRADLLVQLLDARGEVHHVADDRVLLPKLRADAARHGLARVQPDADPRRQHAPARLLLLDAREDFLRRLDGVRAVAPFGERRAEDGHEAVAEELVDDDVPRGDALDH